VAFFALGKVAVNGSDRLRVALRPTWTSSAPSAMDHRFVDDVAQYESGSFYRRELPCILAALKLIDVTKVEAIVVDGYVYLDDDESPGLGAYLYAELVGACPIVGVAKTSFRGGHRSVVPVKRGASEVTLYVSALGITLSEAAPNIEVMHGKFRMPTLLTLLDRETKTWSS
jgi:deoxyribonuclease V